jgi:hypothetical protein
MRWRACSSWRGGRLVEVSAAPAAQQVASAGIQDRPDRPTVHAVVRVCPVDAVACLTSVADRGGQAGAQAAWFFEHDTGELRHSKISP